MFGNFFLVAETGIFQLPQPMLNEFADFVSVVDAAKPGGVEVVVQVSMAHLASTTGGIDEQIGHSQKPLNWALGDGDILNVREGNGHFLNGHDTFANAEAAIGHDVPALFIIEPENRQ